MRLHLFHHARLVTLCATIVVGLALALPTGALAADQGCSDDATGLTDRTASWEADLLRLTNEHRTGIGLAALQLDATLTKASMWKSRDMARRDYFSHEDPANGAAPARSTWDRLASCGWTTGGSRAENIAAGYRTPSEVITGWLNSPGHRKNIENAAMRYVGFGVANGVGSTYGDYSTQMFSSVPGPAATVPMTGGPTGDPASDPASDTSSGEGTGSDDVDGGTRDPLEYGGTPATTNIASVRGRVLRTRCRGRLAVAGWCYRIVVDGRVASTEAGSRRIVLSRRVASRRIVRIASLRTRSNGRFFRSVAIKPPARGTATWLRRNAAMIRIGVAGTDTARGTVRWTSARVALRRR
jgi:uncharacterized protein YkwD